MILLKRIGYVLFALVGYVLLTLLAIALNSIPFLLSKFFYNFMSPTNFWEKMVFLVIIFIPFFVLQGGAVLLSGGGFKNFTNTIKERKNKDEEL